MSANQSFRSRVAALWHKAQYIMDVILHIGAHRTATTSFQAYMRANADVLTARGVGFWGPLRTRNGVLTGVVPVPGVVSAEQQFILARGRIAVQCDRAQANGLRHLVVSDENMIGTMRQNMRFGTLYCGIGERMARYHAAFGGRIARVMISIRSQDKYWASSIASVIPRGENMPNAGTLERVVSAPRSWRDVITDLSCAMPDTEIQVVTYESFGGLPEVKLAQMTNHSMQAPTAHARAWLNRAPDLAALRVALDGRPDADMLPKGEGRWQPFTADQVAAMREDYADDMFWLSAGADGMAKLITKAKPQQVGINPDAGEMTKGHNHDIEQGHLARSG